MKEMIKNLSSSMDQSNATKILTPTGYKLMGDIEVGDKVFDSDGKPTTVLGVYSYPQDKKKVSVIQKIQNAIQSELCDI